MIGRGWFIFRVWPFNTGETRNNWEMTIAKHRLHYQRHLAVTENDEQNTLLI